MELISEWEKQTGWTNVLTHSFYSGMTATFACYVHNPSRRPQKRTTQDNTNFHHM